MSRSHPTMSALAVCVLLLLVLGCAEDEEYGTVFEPTNNPHSFVWRGVYEGTCRLTSRGIAYGQCDVEMRISDLGDDYIRVRCYLRPDFPEAEGSGVEGLVTAYEACWFENPDGDMVFRCSLSRSASGVAGEILAYHSGVGDPEWRISAIQVVKQID